MHKFSQTYLLLFLGLMGLVACVDDSKVNLNDADSVATDTLALLAPPQLSFLDLIPKELTDSVKTKIITRLVTEIKEDSTLTLVQVPDSLNGLLSCYYRNDSLVMLHLGSGLGRSTEDRPMILSGKAKSYYFHSDSLIFSEYHCSSWQQTGRCNPVSVSVWSWFYEREVISQEMDGNIGPYGGCGCGFGYDNFGYDRQMNELMARVKIAKHTAAMQGKEGE